MTLMLSPDTGVPLGADVIMMDVRARMESACATVELLMEHGLDVDVTPADIDAANDLVHAFAEDPVKAQKRVVPARVSRMLPAALIATRDILDRYGHAVVESSVQIRHMVTNRLIQESDSVDPRIRLRALELLGKISDVGLFTERSEVLITHQSTDDLRAKLREKLIKVRDSTVPSSLFDRNPDIQDADIVFPDVEVELGLAP